MTDTGHRELLFSRSSAFPTRAVRESIGAARERIFADIQGLDLWNSRTDQELLRHSAGANTSGSTVQRVLGRPC